MTCFGRKIKNGDNMIYGSKEYYIEKYGKEEVERWIKETEPEKLWWCLSAFSNQSFPVVHRESYLSHLDCILLEDASGLYRTVTYGVCPGDICTGEIGDITGRKNGNIDIAEFLINEKISEIKKWLLNNHEFTEREKRLLHYFNKED